MVLKEGAQESEDSGALTPKEKDGCLYGFLILAAILFTAVAIPLIYRLWVWGFHK